LWDSSTRKSESRDLPPRPTTEGAWPARGSCVTTTWWTEWPSAPGMPSRQIKGIAPVAWCQPACANPCDTLCRAGLVALGACRVSPTKSARPSTTARRLAEAATRLPDVAAWYRVRRNAVGVPFVHQQEECLPVHRRQGCAPEVVVIGGRGARAGAAVPRRRARRCGRLGHHQLGGWRCAHPARPRALGRRELRCLHWRRASYQGVMPSRDTAETRATVSSPASRRARTAAAVVLALPLLVFGSNYFLGVFPLPPNDGSTGAALLDAMRSGGLMSWIAASHVVSAPSC
jgi:hypothetical protein